MKEQAVLFGKDRSLVGVVTDPPEKKRGMDLPAVIFLNSGIVHRVGPNRIYVKMARHLSTMGFVVMRFDFSGIGDSQPRRDTLPFVKSAISEVQEAMGCLKEVRGVGHFVLIGGCSGARISFQAACQDARVVAAFLINYNRGPADANQPANTELASRPTASYYWRFALFNPESWRRFFTGRADYVRIARALGFQLKRRFTHKEATPETIQCTANIRLLAERRVRVLFVWSDGDPGVDELRGGGVEDLVKLGDVGLHVIPKTDHTFSSLHDQRHLLDALGKWASDMVPAGCRGPSTRWKEAALEARRPSVRLSSSTGLNSTV
ncbi:MAG: hypothetical protein DMG32_21295 [Acidobacteria bacterium]|nr:MAG: hypothetical protein DMG32_21295 [Acidobacteriota bacterium]